MSDIKMTELEYTQVLKDWFADPEFVNDLKELLDEMASYESVFQDLTNAGNLAQIVPPSFKYGLSASFLILKINGSKQAELKPLFDKLSEIEVDLAEEKRKNPTGWQDSKVYKDYQKAKRYQAFKNFGASVDKFEAGVYGFLGLVTVQLITGLFTKNDLSSVQGRIQLASDVAAILNIGIEMGLYLYGKYDDRRNNGAFANSALKPWISSIAQLMWVAGRALDATLAWQRVGSQPGWEDVGIIMAIARTGQLIVPAGDFVRDLMKGVDALNKMGGAKTLVNGGSQAGKYAIIDKLKLGAVATKLGLVGAIADLVVTTIYLVGLAVALSKKDLSGEEKGVLAAELVLQTIRWGISAVSAVWIGAAALGAVAGPPGWVAAAVFVALTSALLSPMAIYGAVKTLELAGKIRGISDDYRKLGFGGYDNLSSLVFTQGIADLMFAIFPLVGILLAPFKQLILESAVDEQRAKILQEYGSFDAFWSRSFQAEWSTLLANKDFRKILNEFHTLVGGGGFDSVIMLSSLTPNQLQHHLAAILREGGSLKPVDDVGIILSDEAPDGKETLSNTMIDREAGLIDLSKVDAGSLGNRYVYMNALSPSYERGTRKEAGKNSYTTDIIIKPKAWVINDDDSSSTVNLGGLSFPDEKRMTPGVDASGNRLVSATLDMKGGNDVIFMGGRIIDAQMGAGFDGVDYTHALVLPTKEIYDNLKKNGVDINLWDLNFYEEGKNKFGINAKFSDSDSSVIVSKYGSSLMQQEFKETVEYTYGKRKETIETVSTQGIHVWLNGQYDRITDVEWIKGSIGFDVLRGNSADNYFVGGSGGHDFIYGEAGSDWIDYGMIRELQIIYKAFGQDPFVLSKPLTSASVILDRDAAVNAGIISSQIAHDSLGYIVFTPLINAGAFEYGGSVYGKDYLYGIENVRGGAWNELIVGTNGDNILIGNGGSDAIYGLDGNDIITTGLTGNAYVDGGAGSNVLDYGSFAVPLLVTLADDGLGFVQKAEGRDTFKNIAAFRGGAKADVFSGGQSADFFNGESGADQIYAYAGDDRISTGTGRDTVDAGYGDDVISVSHTRSVSWAIKEFPARTVALGSGSLSQLNFDDENCKFEIYALNQSSVCKITSISRQVDGSIALWLEAPRLTWWGTITYGLKVLLQDNPSTGLSASLVEARYYELDVKGYEKGKYKAGDPIPWHLQDELSVDSFFLAGINISGVGNQAWSDLKVIDGGQGNDMVDYQSLEVVGGSGIEADLSNPLNQTVKTWRRSDGSINTASVTDLLKNIESLGATNGNDKITGSDDDNSFVGYGGNDYIDAKGGNDLIGTGRGNDTVLAGAGDDTIIVDRNVELIGRYVMVRKNEGVNDYLSLAELQAWSSGRNLAQGKTVTSSGSHDNNLHFQNNLVDGKTGGNMATDGIYASSTRGGGWIQVDLGSTVRLDQINLFGRTDGAASQNGNYTVYLSDQDMSKMTTSQIEGLPNVVKSRYDGRWLTATMTRNALAENSLDRKVIDGGDGSDTVDYKNEAVVDGTKVLGLDVDLSNVGNQRVKTKRLAGGNFDVGSVQDDLKNIENLGATGGDDKIIGSDLDNRIWAYAGDDSIEGRGGDDVILTGAGNDTVLGGSGDDTVIVQRGTALSGRYVMVRKNEGVNECLSLAELQAWSGGKNLAQGKTVTSSGSHDNHLHFQNNLVDGNTGGNTATDGIYGSPRAGGDWVQVDLGSTVRLDQINLFGRTDGWAYQNGNYTVYLSDQDMSKMSTADIEKLPGVVKSRHEGQLSTVIVPGGTLWSSQIKVIDGGDGVDMVDYVQTVITDGLGIDADLKTVDSQTVKRLPRPSEPTVSPGLVDMLKNIENLGATGGHDRVMGSEGANKIWGYGGDDLIDGRGGDDFIVTGVGTDTVFGGEGDDTIIAERGQELRGRYIMVRKNEGANDVLTLAELQVWSNGQNVAQNKTVVSSGSLNATTHAASNLVDGQTGGNTSTDKVFTSSLDALAYIASHADLIKYCGTDAEAGKKHYFEYGAKEGRTVTFDALSYIASHQDLIQRFGTDVEAAKKHFIEWGSKEGRKTTFNAKQYLLNYADLQKAYGFDLEAAARHFILYGSGEGRTDAVLPGASDGANINWQQPSKSGWIQVDLGSAMTLDQISLFGRTGQAISQNGNYTVYLSDQDMSKMSTAEIEKLPTVIKSRHEGPVDKVTITRDSPQLDGTRKFIDGGDGTDTVDYQKTPLFGMAGIDVDLSNVENQTVRTQRYADGKFGLGSVIDTLKSIENLGATNGDDRIIGSDEANRIWGYEGDDYIEGRGGNDVIMTGAGSDTVLGGAGDDTVVIQRGTTLTGRYIMVRKNEGANDVLTLAELQVWSNGQNVAQNKTVVSSGSLNATTHAASNLVDGQTGGNTSTDKVFTSSLDALAYIASHADLIKYCGTDAEAGKKHYLEYGAKEGRPVTFDALSYIASHPDLIKRYGTDVEGATKHFIEWGSKEGRKTTFNAKQYLLNYADLQKAYGFDLEAAARHFILYGSGEGRTDAVLPGASDGANINWQQPSKSGWIQVDLGSAMTLDQISLFGRTGQGISQNGNYTVYLSDRDMSKLSMAEIEKLPAIIKSRHEGPVDKVTITKDSLLPPPPMVGRYVMVRKNEGVNDYLSLAELQAWSGGKNLAQGKTVTSSGSHDNQLHFQNNLVDGKTGGNMATDGIYGSPRAGGDWIQVDLGSTVRLDQINLFGRTDGWASQNGNYTVYLSDQDMSKMSTVQLESMNNVFKSRHVGQVAQVTINSASWLMERASKLIDGGDGSDTVDYRQLELINGVGIDVNLSDAQQQTVLTPHPQGQLRDQLKNVENLGATNGNDRVIGSEENNQIWGYDGHDYIEGRGGNDVIMTGEGSDTVLGGAGDDTVVIQRGRALTGRYIMVRKNAGVNDFLSLAELQAWSGSDNLAQGKTLISSGSLDKVGHFQNHLVDGRTGGNVMVDGIYSSSTRGGGWIQVDLGSSRTLDRINVFGRTDAASSQNGNYTVYLSDQDMSKMDTVQIEALPDVIKSRHEGQLGEVVITRDSRLLDGTRKFIDGGDGTDTVDYQKAPLFDRAGIDVDLSNVQNQTVRTHRYADGKFGWASEIDTLKSVENLGATNGDDRIIGSELANRIWGNEGDDYIEGRGGDDVIMTGAGSDTVLGGAGDDIVVVQRGATLTGRYIMVRKNEGVNDFLSLAELQAWSGSDNLAQGKTLISSGSHDTNTHFQNNLVDGKTGGNQAVDGIYASSTRGGGWIQVDLGSSRTLDRINVFGRTDAASSQNGNYTVYLSDQDMSKMSTAQIEATLSVIKSRHEGPVDKVTITKDSLLPPPPMVGRYVMVRKNEGVNDYLSLAELQAWSGGKNLAQGKTVTSSGSHDNQLHFQNNLVDGKTGGNMATDGIYGSPRAGGDWIQVDLGSTVRLDQINLFGRTDGWASQNGNYTVYLSDQDMSKMSTVQLESMNNVFKSRHVGQVAQVTINSASWLMERASKLIDGGDGSDTVDYRQLELINGVGIDVNLSDAQQQTVLTPHPQGQLRDQLKNVENLGATNGNDRVIGSEENNQIWGYDGHDYIEGRGGNDVIMTGEGSDTVLGGAGDDTVVIQRGRALTGRYIMVRKNAGVNDFLSLAELQAWSGSDNLAQGKTLISSGSLDKVGHFQNHLVDGRTGGNVMVDGIYSSSTRGGGWIQVDLGSSRTLDRINVFGRTDAASSQNGNYTVYLSDQDMSKMDTVQIEALPDVIKSRHEGQLGEVVITRDSRLLDGTRKFIDGGDGTDTVDYQKTPLFDRAGIDVDLSNVQNQTVRTHRYADGKFGWASEIDTLKSVENLGATNGDDRIIGSELANRIWGNEGDDYIEGRGGNDIIVTGGGQDTALGGEGDDAVYVEHVMQSQLVGSPTNLQSGYVSMGTSARVSEVDLLQDGTVVKLGRSIQARLNGSALEPIQAKLVRINREATGLVTCWAQVVDNGQTKAFKLHLRDTPQGLEAKISEAAYVVGDVSGQDFDWDRSAVTYRTWTGTTLDFNYLNVQLKVFAYADVKSIDGGGGTDFVSYRHDSDVNIRRSETGIAADLELGSVKTWRYSDGTFNPLSAVDRIKNIENIGGSQYSDSLRGDTKNNILVGYEGADILNGLTGDDTLVGGVGADTYLMNANWGVDVISEDASSGEDMDLLVFGEGISYADLWFSKQGDHLVMNQLGSANQVAVQNWYSADATKKAQVEVFRTSINGSTYVATLERVESLVNTLSAYSRPGTTIKDSTLTSTQKVAINAALSQAWQLSA